MHSDIRDHSRTLMDFEGAKIEQNGTQKKSISETSHKIHTYVVHLCRLTCKDYVRHGEI